MTREQIRNDILGIQSNCILAELPTSVGKSRVALDFMKERDVKGRILIVIPRNVLIDNWKEEFVKWGYEPYIPQVTFTTYISLPKHVGDKFELVIFDECHHLSERAREAAEELVSDYYILLSATVTRTLKRDIKTLFPGIACYKISMREAIEEDILPDPKVFLIPLTLNAVDKTEKLIINPSKKLKGEIPFSQRFVARKDKNHQYIVPCTQEEFYQDTSAMADYYKRTYFHTNNQFMYFRWQRKSKDRLEWLASLKNDIILQILDKLKDKRTLTFCNGIEQTKALGQYCINSENKDSGEYIKAFNEGKINHITACNMLNEGMNLVACQIGIFVSINSSDIMIKQKNGRILRHSDPIIIIVYYRNTREEELVNEIIQNYNQELVTVVNKEQLNGNKDLF